MDKKPEEVVKCIKTVILPAVTVEKSFYSPLLSRTKTEAVTGTPVRTTRCTLPYAQPAEKVPKSLSSPGKTDLYTAETATVRL